MEYEWSVSGQRSGSNLGNLPMHYGKLQEGELKHPELSVEGLSRDQSQEKGAIPVSWHFPVTDICISEVQATQPFCLTNYTNNTFIYQSTLN